ncbi:uncharacterized protein AB675_2302 [Cyphellophora attinorum]|uniref:Uncharacterized protein n=1 Tax=Cyphellophora attinorum TaxID=1664694 RepID=A0A0N1HAU0_9EURO|nr:uncharacterized protein AB675_2302 [Phialophora attinorum]KPI45313.1 hypothetical protein AB675_2302 [Phialophora attinorum]
MGSNQTTPTPWYSDPNGDLRQDIFVWFLFIIVIDRAAAMYRRFRPANSINTTASIAEDRLDGCQEVSDANVSEVAASIIKFLSEHPRGPQNGLDEMLEALLQYNKLSKHPVVFDANNARCTGGSKTN